MYGIDDELISYMLRMEAKRKKVQLILVNELANKLNQYIENELSQNVKCKANDRAELVMDILIYVNKKLDLKSRTMADFERTKELVACYLSNSKKISIITKLAILLFLILVITIVVDVTIDTRKVLSGSSIAINQSQLDSFYGERMVGAKVKDSLRNVDEQDIVAPDILNPVSIYEVIYNDDDKKVHVNFIR